MTCQKILLRDATIVLSDDPAVEDVLLDCRKLTIVHKLLDECSEVVVVVVCALASLELEEDTGDLANETG